MPKKDSRTQEKLQRKFFRQSVHFIWDMVKADRLEELSGKERKMAELLICHREYADHFENTSILDGSEYEGGAVFNPFFHISIHQMVEDQLSTNTPPEAVSFCEAMESKGLSRHDAIHYIMMILIHVIYASATTGAPFDLLRYKQLLSECCDIEPSAIERFIQ